MLKLASNQDKNWVIKWKHKNKEIEGQGTTKFTVETANDIARQANKDFPFIEHWAYCVGREGN